MAQGYKITSYSAIFPMMFSFKKEDDDAVLNLNVEVDYFNNKVYFRDTSKYPDVDFCKLEEAILEELTPKDIEQPEISEEVFERINRVREDDYSQSLMKDINGENYDSR